jgi:hypothetical protein
VEENLMHQLFSPVRFLPNSANSNFPVSASFVASLYQQVNKQVYIHLMKRKEGIEEVTKQ